MRGTYSHIPAENVSIETEEIDGDYYIKLKGEMRFTALFGRNLVLRREISMKYLGDELTVNDVITNDGFVDGEYYLMYHVNLGYPLLCEDTKLTVDTVESIPLNDTCDMDRWTMFEKPTPGRPEECYFHTLKEGKGIKARVENNTHAVSFIVDSKEFPYILQWKSMACGDYVLGVEPVTTKTNPKIPNVIKAGESAKHSVTWIFEEK